MQKSTQKLQKSEKSSLLAENEHLLGKNGKHAFVTKCIRVCILVAFDESKSFFSLRLNLFYR